jgi:hypothetical protein
MCFELFLSERITTRGSWGIVMDKKDKTGDRENVFQ